MACIKESRENMEIFLESVRNQLVDVSNLVWNEKNYTCNCFFLGITIFHLRFTVSLVPMASILACGV